ncbi:hypothetical protein J6590_026697 [Homalodisca vitripennis]|nr:hypothetical protein J6590_026697 [Homalodisca vitripennis]
MDQAIFQQDGAPPHFANPVKRLLNDNLHGRYIGRGIVIQTVGYLLTTCASQRTRALERCAPTA